MSQELAVDADGHVMEADDLWVERTDHRRWGDWIPRKILDDEVYETVYVGGAMGLGVSP